MTSYSFVGSGDFNDRNHWKDNSNGSGPPAGPPGSSDSASIWNGSATASGDVSTANGGSLQVGFGSTLTVSGRLTYALTGLDNNGASSDIFGGSVVKALGGLTLARSGGSRAWLYM